MLNIKSYRTLLRCKKEKLENNNNANDANIPTLALRMDGEQNRDNNCKRRIESIITPYRLPLVQ